MVDLTNWSEAAGLGRYVEDMIGNGWNSFEAIKLKEQKDKLAFFPLTGHRHLFEAACTQIYHKCTFT